MFTVNALLPHGRKRRYIIANTTRDEIMASIDSSALPTNEKVYQSFARRLQEWSLFAKYRIDNLEVRRVIAGSSVVGWWVGFHERGTNLDVIIVEKTLYLCSITLDECYRGQGHGAALYKALEDIAADIGCGEIRQSPGGLTVTGETRRDYLLRRGWIEDQHEVYKIVARDK